MSRRQSRGCGSGGFTLIELLIVLVILPLIVGAIADAVITTVRNDDSVSGSLSDSSSAQILSGYYVRDVASASSVTTATGAEAPVPCGTAASGLNDYTFELGLVLGASGNNVAYWLNTSSGKLARVFCTPAGVTPTSTVSVCLATTPLAVAGGTPCQGTAALQLRATVSASDPTIPFAAASGWTTTAGVSAISLSAVETASTYAFSLLGAPRVLNPQEQNALPGGNP
jgi:prepilin-type N-terminal cleavage/methylation domain-containing protein